MNEKEYGDSHEGKLQSKTVDCFCSGGCENLRGVAWVAMDSDGSPWSDSLSFEIRVTPGIAMLHRRLWTRIALAWQALIHGQMHVHWVEGSMEEWREMAKWILSINPVKEEPKSDG